MRYKLIAADMDGTLLTPDGRISERTIESIKKAEENGVIFTLSTGRPLQGVKRYIDQLNIDCYLITYNGAVIVHSKTDQILYNEVMDNIEAQKVYNLAVKKGTMFIVWSQNRLYASEFSEKTKFYEEITKTKAEPIIDFNQLIAQGITKILWYDEPDVLAGWIDEIKKEKLMSTTFTKSRAYFLEFFSNRTSKAVAMEKLGEYYNIDKKRMVAIGDQTNDLPMIEYAGLGVAMGNAVDSVKEKADYITETNANDGVAEVIEKFILNNTD
ncbi:MAG: HAD family phosphatase [Oscillospiraceae bacterium]|nr:HAD family phosphatase [Oscillospiraceae bacterium]